MLQTKKVYKFNSQNKTGVTGENLFSTCYNDLEPKKPETLAYDFDIKSNKKIELKSDTWGMEDTPNFFMESISNSSKGTIGGPWRAKKDGVDFFVYLFLKNKTFFWFDTLALCDKLDQLSPQLKKRTIFNSGYDTIGYLVNRESLRDLILSEDRFE